MISFLRSVPTVLSHSSRSRSSSHSHLLPWTHTTLPPDVQAARLKAAKLKYKHSEKGEAGTWRATEGAVVEYYETSYPSQVKPNSLSDALTTVSLDHTSSSDPSSSRGPTPSLRPIASTSTRE